ncbi:sulfur carrier protein ThiS [Sedimenticola hydrogenitrophicus]|uniref:sulfur carrier protein ThiS n=1 Tax=Sedimenticola hydrogenitrophicus TaxID=2967975 RepID=UPI0023AEB5C1|nr:MoaD/ThiS family protein [Sedimenticola hydrogenitrophicus]
MKVNFKLYASLGQYLPPGAEDHQIALDVDAGISPARLLDQQGVPQAEVHLVLVNGVFIPPGQRDNPLTEGDELAVWPAVAGG